MPIMLIQDLITTGIENVEYVVGLYLDPCKAFDTVDHNILLKKLNQYGIKGHALDKFKSYLTNRKQTVSVDGVKASLRNINTGVPQGSILEPLLFIVYMNDLVNLNTGGQFFLYADDTVVFFRHTNIEKLQTIVDEASPKIADWLKANSLTLNTSKTVAQLHTKRKGDLKFQVGVNGKAIKQVETVKYLGVLIDSDMKFTSPIK